MKVCVRCQREKGDVDFLAGKAKRESSMCAACRRKASDRHRRKYYASLPPDKRHSLGSQRRAKAAGVGFAPYSRVEILARWNGRCAYCDKPAEHLDHVHPISKGGEDRESNILPACALCNLTKGAKTLAEWAETFGDPPF